MSEDEELLTKGIYNDSFQIGLYKLLFIKGVRNFKMVYEALDNNGYCGRYKISSVLTKSNISKNNIRIEVYLPDSKISYIWPRNNGYFSFDTGKITGKNIVCKLNYVKDGMLFLRERKEISVDYWILCDGIPQPDEMRKIIDLLYEYNLVTVSGELKLKTKGDIDEFCENVFYSKKY